MGKVNVNFKKIVNSNKAFQKKAESTIKEKYLESKQNFLENFDAHPVSQEISAGETASNSSGTLNGVGNLFSFIGFNRGSDPIGELRQKLLQKFMFKKSTTGDKLKFIISFPTLDKLKSDTPMPWEAGNSWLAGIERGISGFSFYMYKKFVEGRSGEGLQSKNKVRSSVYKRTKYITELVEKFMKDIK